MGYTFHFPPAPAAVGFAEVSTHANAWASGDHLDVRDQADDLELHPSSSTDAGGRMSPKKVGGFQFSFYLAYFFFDRVSERDPRNSLQVAVDPGAFLDEEAYLFAADSSVKPPKFKDYIRASLRIFA